MSHSGRLFDLIQNLRRRRTPVTAAELAEELGVSSRTVYRDIAVLTARGMSIRGAAGLGYVLEPGCFLPPLTFTEDELDAIVLGLRWVERRADPELSLAADNALTKVAVVLSARVREGAEAPRVFVGPDLPHPTSGVAITVLRHAVRHKLKIELTYRDASETTTERVLWPIGLAFMESNRFLVAWCELRAAFRSFRLDRILTAELREAFPERRAVLLTRWRGQLHSEAAAATRCQQPQIERSTSPRGGVRTDAAARSVLPKES